MSFENVNLAKFVRFTQKRSNFKSLRENPACLGLLNFNAAFKKIIAKSKSTVLKTFPRGTAYSSSSTSGCEKVLTRQTPSKTVH